MNESKREMDVIVTIILQEYFEEWIAPLMIFDVEMISVNELVSFFLSFHINLVVLRRFRVYEIRITYVIIYILIVII